MGRKAVNSRVLGTFSVSKITIWWLVSHSDLVDTLGGHPCPRGEHHSLDLGIRLACNKTEV